MPAQTTLNTECPDMMRVSSAGRSMRHIRRLFASTCKVTLRSIAAPAARAIGPAATLMPREYSRGLQTEIAAMPRAKVSIANVAEAGPGLWSNCIRAGDLLFISGQVARQLEGGGTLVG